MNEQNLIVQMISDFKDENQTQHKAITDHLATLNGSVAKIKRSQLLVKGVLIGAGAVLILLGFMPERIYQLLKSALL